jgi:hypothetical protein
MLRQCRNPLSYRLARWANRLMRTLFTADYTVLAAPDGWRSYTAFLLKTDEQPGTAVLP